jgi:hypothetical protein
MNAYLVNTTQLEIFKRLLTDPHQLAPQTISTDPSPQSIVFAGNGDAYVGHLGGRIRRYVRNTGGVLEQKEYVDVPVDTSDSFWLDIAADWKTIFYTSGGRNIRRVTVPSTNAPTFSTASLVITLPDTPSGAPTSRAARALRLLPPASGAGNDEVIGGILVADKANIKLVQQSETGWAVTGQYDAVHVVARNSQAQDDWFALALDPRDVEENGADRGFWTGDKTTGKIWRFNVQAGISKTGNAFAAPQSATPIQTEATGTLRGICLNGEPTTGQYSAILKFNKDTDSLSDTAIFAFGTELTEQHSFRMRFDSSVLPSGPVNVAVNAREAISDGVCAGGASNTADVDCGFVKYFSAPKLPIGAAYAHGRAVSYRVNLLRPNIGQPETQLTISSKKQFKEILTDATVASPCSSSSTSRTGRALRVLRDPRGGITTENPTQEDQFQFDVLDAFFIDEFGTRTKTNRFMAAFRCSNGNSAITKPADNRTFKAGNSIPIELRITDASGNPTATATAQTLPHNIVATIGTDGQVIELLGTPGSSPAFFTFIGSGTYSANLQTGGLLVPSNKVYNFCISDIITPITPNEVPLYPQQCVSFFLK